MFSGPSAQARRWIDQLPLSGSTQLVSALQYVSNRIAEAEKLYG
jgi:hypothetical protein